jgi:hypothetical protein
MIAAAVLSSAGTRQQVAGILGLAAIVILLLAYSQGFGILGGRVTPLSGRGPRSRTGQQPAPGGREASRDGSPGHEDALPDDEGRLIGP